MYEYLEFVIGFATACVGIAAYMLSKRRVYADIIASGRLKWIELLREKIVEFINIYYEEYEKPEGQRFSLEAKLFEIELFFNYSYENKAYEDLQKCLYSYLHQPSNIKKTNHEELVEKSQGVLDATFSRAKAEAGISKRMNERNRTKFGKQKGFK